MAIWFFFEEVQEYLKKFASLELYLEPLKLAGD